MRAKRTVGRLNWAHVAWFNQSKSTIDFYFACSMLSVLFVVVCVCVCIFLNVHSNEWITWLHKLGNDCTNDHATNKNSTYIDFVYYCYCFIFNRILCLRDMTTVCKYTEKRGTHKKKRMTHLLNKSALAMMTTRPTIKSCQTFVFF